MFQNINKLLRGHMSQLVVNPKLVAILTIPLFIVVYLYVLRPADNRAAEILGSAAPADNEDVKEGVDWKTVDLEHDDLPVNIVELRGKVQIQQVTTKPIGGAATFIQLADPPSGVDASGQVVLLLHGAAFSSQTWVDGVPTIATLAAMGHRVIAIDLPGYGKGKGEHVSEKGKYLNEVISQLTPDVKPMVVSPSMSGSFVVPFLAEFPDKISGWVPVAPGTSGPPNGKDFFQKLKVPTMIVYGELDGGGPRSAAVLALIPTSTKPQVLAKAKHPAYLDQPELWHKLLFNFMKLL